jgi:hypothetical protein
MAMPDAQTSAGKIDVTILDFHDMPSPDAQRLGKTDRLVLYEMADKIRRAVRLPAESADDQTVARAIRADIEKHAKWAGRRLSV